MLNPTFEKQLKEGDSRYTMVMLAAKRARQIVEGSETLVESKSEKAVTIAIEEILAGKVNYLNPSEYTELGEEAKDLEIEELEVVTIQDIEE